jgi:hypothetical protein
LSHTSAKFFLRPAIFSNRDRCTVSWLAGCRSNGDKMIELQRKAEKYEGKVAQCKDRAKRATEGPQRAFFDTLANYYESLAADFRQTIARRTAA